jgi:hypothetical protein
MAHLIQSATANDLMRDVTSRLVYHPHPEADEDFLNQKRVQPVDMVSSVDTHLLNVIAEAESFQWEFDLKSAWLTKARFNTLIRQYINPIALENWLDTVEAKLGKRKRGTAVMRTNLVQKRGNTNRPSRQWGSCMLAISFRRIPRPQITLYSRTSYFGYIGYLDMTVAHVCAKMISERTGVPVEDMKFVWQIEDAQWSWKSLSYMFQTEERAKTLWNAREALKNDDTSDQLWFEKPGLFVAALWFDRFLLEDEEGVKYGDMTWGSCGRVRRRYHTEVMGADYGKTWEGWEGVGKLKGQSKRFPVLPSCSSNTLDFSALAKLRNEPDPAESAEMANFTEDGCECLYGDTGAEVA